jgi:hypothetical protein
MHLICGRSFERHSTCTSWDFLVRLRINEYNLFTCSTLFTATDVKTIIYRSREARGINAKVLFIFVRVSG